ncbi:MAG TPA: hypothetical protein VLJ57_15290 [Burkholderiaceae bacterium]|nr:hypothetical protein [Burkholderiaceae bacterium]
MQLHPPLGLFRLFRTRLGNPRIERITTNPSQRGKAKEKGTWAFDPNAYESCGLGGAYVDTFIPLGAELTQLLFPEVYESLRTGKVEAQENPLITINYSKILRGAKAPDAVAPCLQRTGHAGQQAGV